MMKRIGYCTFETSLGVCGIAWAEAADAALPPAVTHFQLPEATAAHTEARLVRTCGASGPAAPPPPIAALIRRVGRHLQGEAQDFTDVALALDGVGPFARRVYAAARRIPPGQTRTYGELARAVGRPAAARAVGQALGRNPIALLVPCHRVVAASGRPGGFSAHGGWATKARLLALEGARVPPRETA